MREAVFGFTLGLGTAGIIYSALQQFYIFDRTTQNDISNEAAVNSDKTEAKQHNEQLDSTNSELKSSSKKDSPTGMQAGGGPKGSEDDTMDASSSGGGLPPNPMEKIVSKIRAQLKREGWAKQNMLRDREERPFRLMIDLE